MNGITGFLLFFNASKKRKMEYQNIKKKKKERTHSNKDKDIKL